MKLKFNVLFLSFFAVLLSACSSSKNVANGGYSDLSLLQNPNQFTLTRLNEVKESGKSFWGIPLVKKEKTQGLVVRFNGINLTATDQVLPILTMVGFSLSGIVNTYAILNSSFNPDPGKFSVGWATVSTIISVPIAGVMNNLLWTNSAFSSAAHNLNSRLVSENKNIDLFLNPKYEIEKKTGLWTQSASISAKVLGATLNVEGAPNFQRQVIPSPGTSSVYSEPVSASRANNTNFRIGDKVDLTDLLNINGEQTERKIFSAEVYDISDDLLYIRYKFMGETKEVIRHYKTVTKSH